MGIPKIKSATHFRETLYETLREVCEGQFQIISNQNGQNVVLISQEDYNKLLEECETQRSIALGVLDLDSGKSVSHKKATATLRKLKASWK